MWNSISRYEKFFHQVKIDFTKWGKISRSAKWFHDVKFQFTKWFWYHQVNYGFTKWLFTKWISPRCLDPTFTWQQNVVNSSLKTVEFLTRMSITRVNLTMCMYNFGTFEWAIFYETNMIRSAQFDYSVVNQ